MMDRCSFVANFYPRPPRGGRPDCGLQRIIGNGISIHALREEGDGTGCQADPGCPISIHALREEGDLLGDSGMGARFQFLSTPSARRATWAIWMDALRTPISIHALREEGDERSSSYRR